MGALFVTPELFRVYVETGIQNRLPVFVPKQTLALLPPDAPFNEDIIPVEYLGSVAPGTRPEDWEDFYIGLLDKAQPGLNEIIVHLGFDDSELQGITVNHPDFGAKWRSLDLEVVESPSFKQAMKDRNIRLVTYREIQELIYK
jgi:hypothetical protein